MPGSIIQTTNASGKVKINTNDGTRLIQESDLADGNGEVYGGKIVAITTNSPTVVMKANVTGSLAFAFSQGSVVTDTDSVVSFPNLTKLSLENLNVYSISSTKKMIQNAPELSKVNVSGWYVEDVTDMEGTFYKNPKLATIIGLETWKPSKVENLAYFFSLNWNLDEKSIKNVESWFTKEKFPRNLKNMEYMFWNNTQLTSLNLSSEGWAEASSQITTLKGTFGANSNLNTVILNEWNLNEIQNLDETFRSTANLTSLSGLEKSVMNNLSSMNKTFYESGLELIDLTSFNPSGLVATDQTFYSPSTKKLLITNFEIENTPTTVLEAYSKSINGGPSKFQTDNRKKYEFPYLDANGGEFKDENDQKSYINNIVQRKFKIFPSESMGDLATFKRENSPSRKGYTFKGWEPSSLDPTLTSDNILTCVDSANVVDYNKNKIYFKAIWDADNPATGPDNERPSDINDE